MVRFLREGGMVGVVLDQHTGLGEPVMFVERATGLPSPRWHCATTRSSCPAMASAAPTAVYIWFETPSNRPTLTMTQALNDDLERQVRAHMDQWLCGLPALEEAPAGEDGRPGRRKA